VRLPRQRLPGTARGILRAIDPDRAGISRRRLPGAPTSHYWRVRSPRRPSTWSGVWATPWPAWRSPGWALAPAAAAGTGPLSPLRLESRRSPYGWRRRRQRCGWTLLATRFRMSPRKPCP